jgi:OmpA-OmpF porin, OOP family
MTLSQARADAVAKYLVGKGISPERLRARGYGPQQPVDKNETAAGREANRRVEFKVLAPDAAD